MANLTPKQLGYIAARVEGLKKRESAIAAGYSSAGADVAAAKCERDERIRKAIAAGKRKLNPRDRSKPKPESDEKEKPRLKPKYDSSLELMRGVYNNPLMPDSVRIDAAKAALPFEHGRIVDTGKKQKKVEAAKAIAAGAGGKTGKPKFATKAPPALRSIQGGKK